MEALEKLGLVLLVEVYSGARLRHCLSSEAQDTARISFEGQVHGLDQRHASLTHLADSFSCKDEACLLRRGSDSNYSCLFLQ